MIGNEFWDRSIFGIIMILIGIVFTWFMWDKSIILALVGVANILFVAYIIWGAFAWENYKEAVWEKHGKDHERSKSNPSS